MLPCQRPLAIALVAHCMEVCHPPRRICHVRFQHHLTRLLPCGVFTQPCLSGCSNRILPIASLLRLCLRIGHAWMWLWISSSLRTSRFRAHRSFWTGPLSCILQMKPEHSLTLLRPDAVQSNYFPAQIPLYLPSAFGKFKSLPLCLRLMRRQMQLLCGIGTICVHVHAHPDYAVLQPAQQRLLA